MKKRMKIIILLSIIIVILVIIIGKDLVKKGAKIPLSDYVTVSTTTINHGGIIKKRDDIPSNQKIPSDPILVDISDEAIEGWSIYESERFGFSIKYPCNLSCPNSTTQLRPRDSAYLSERISLGIIDKRLSIGIGVFTKESVEQWDAYLKEVTQDPNFEIGEPERFKFSLESMSDAIKFPAGSSPNLMVKIGETEELYQGLVQIVNTQEGKAILLQGFTRYFFNRAYFIPRNDTEWIQITETYWDSKSRSYDPSLIDDYTREIMKVAESVIKTLKFTK